MGLVKLNISPRSTTGKNANRRTRAAGQVPAVLYGAGRETENVALDAHAFGVVLSRLAGRSSIFVLEREGSDDEPIALLREVQRNPVTDEILHVDLLEIPRGEPVTVPVSVHVTGESPAVRNGEGSVALSLDTIEVSCLPRDLPEQLEVDITGLGLNDKVFVRDVKTPVGEIVEDPDLLVLNIKPATILVEETDEEAEGEEGAEGEAAGEGEAEGDEDGKSEE